MGQVLCTHTRITTGDGVRLRDHRPGAGAALRSHGRGAASRVRQRATLHERGAGSGRNVRRANSLSEGFRAYAPCRPFASALREQHEFSRSQDRVAHDNASVAGYGSVEDQPHTQDIILRKPMTLCVHAFVGTRCRMRPTCLRVTTLTTLPR